MIRSRRSYIVAGSLALAGLLAVLPLYAQVTRVVAEWVDGNLVYYTFPAKTEIATIDGVNRKLSLPSGSVLDLSAATGSILFAAGEIVAADLATDSGEA